MANKNPNKIKDLKHDITFPNVHPLSKWDKKSFKIYSDLTDEQIQDLLERLEYTVLCVKGEISFRKEHAEEGDLK